MTQLVNPLEVLKSISDATTALIQKAAKSVVSVNSHMSQGTGIVIDKEGYIVTCNHVLHGCNTVKVGQGEKTYPARIVGTDPYNDVALLKVDKSGLTAIELGDSTKLQTGQFVLALANPFNRAQPTATTGIVTNPDAALRQWRSTSMENVIATDAKLNPGFSGGPLIDATGKLIGMNTAYVWSRGIAIPVNKVKAISDRLLHGGHLKRAYLGIVTNTVAIPAELAEQAGIEQETGVMVFSVERGSPARQAGLTMGDVIIKFNGKPVTSFYDLPTLLTEDVVGKETEIEILREEKRGTLTIIPKEAQEIDDD
ncbi:MAG TPA: trypsin-like peptidase domain-containing protein [Candidatus Sulfotelmatobacter sp.]|nr:trypsin-like peptidase domain-containing protein [Candidatus Sulfotelmatobacter sp.]